tara:strand:- start:103 stop:708 length:606 start_codon:yes stop_codon:yes gene_type:complete
MSCVGGEYFTFLVGERDGISRIGFDVNNHLVNGGSIEFGTLSKVELVEFTAEQIGTFDNTAPGAYDLLSPGITPMPPTPASIIQQSVMQQADGVVVTQWDVGKRSLKHLGDSYSYCGYLSDDNGTCPYILSGTISNISGQQKSSIMLTFKTYDSQGYANTDNITVFIDGLLPGDQAKFAIGLDYEMIENYSIIKLLEIWSY